jgi:hypothetical protein
VYRAGRSLRELQFDMTTVVEREAQPEVASGAVAADASLTTPAAREAIALPDMPGPAFKIGA